MIVINPSVLITHRVRKGLSKSGLARELGLAASSISRAEAEKGVSAKTAQAMCEFFNIEPQELLRKTGGAYHESVSSSSMVTS